MRVVRGNSKYPDPEPDEIDVDQCDAADVNFDRLVLEYHNAKRFAEDAAQRVSVLKEMVVAALKVKGASDDKGHLWVKSDKFTVKHERRVSNLFRAEDAAAWADSHGMLDDLSETVTMLVEEKFLELAYERPELASEIQSLYSEKESWALKVQEV